jgi:hypothetical protein
MKKPKPPIRTLVLQTEEELNKIKKMYPESDFVRCIKWIELRLPEKASLIINGKNYHRFRLESKK